MPATIADKHVRVGESKNKDKPVRLEFDVTMLVRRNSDKGTAVVYLTCAQSDQLMKNLKAAKGSCHPV